MVLNAKEFSYTQSDALKLSIIDPIFNSTQLPSLDFITPKDKLNSSAQNQRKSISHSRTKSSSRRFGSKKRTIGVGIPSSLVLYKFQQQASTAKLNSEVLMKKSETDQVSLENVARRYVTKCSESIAAIAPSASKDLYPSVLENYSTFSSVLLWAAIISFEGLLNKKLLLISSSSWFVVVYYHETTLHSSSSSGSSSGSILYDVSDLNETARSALDFLQSSGFLQSGSVSSNIIFSTTIFHNEPAGMRRGQFEIRSLKVRESLISPGRQLSQQHVTSLFCAFTSAIVTLLDSETYQSIGDTNTRKQFLTDLKETVFQAFSSCLPICFNHIGSNAVPLLSS